MLTKEFNEFVAKFTQEMENVLVKKGYDYTGGEDIDRLSNFKTIANRLGVSPVFVWFIYFSKHIDSLTTYVKTGVSRSEPIRGRCIDVANYAILGAALIEEETEKV